ncbi:DUF262 domain-containing protein [Corynebacterium sp. H78]|uniref:DUF262 domain-containing protein n=1 Tax=Corynebacterium sp. H78 TaxID=3133417 RepID=UPI003095DBA3
MKGHVTRILTVFDGNSKRLIIPVYQRNYNWRPEQCERLYDDLVDIIRTERPTHFFGSVVGENEDVFTYVVIDGQQRLTTTSLLLLALTHSLENGILTSDNPGLVRRIRRTYLETNDAFDESSNEVKFKLKPVKDDGEAYRRLLAGDDDLIDSSTITINYRYFMKRIEQGELSGDELFTAIGRLQIMLLELEDQDAPQRIFESLNSTGLELSEADKIRNLVLMDLTAQEQEHLYENYWNRIEKTVDYRTDWFIRWYLTAKTRKTPRQDRVYEAFRKFLGTKDIAARGIPDILHEMREFAEHTRQLLHADTGIPAADRKLRRFFMIPRDISLPFLMPLLSDVRAGVVSEESFAAIIGMLDSYLFRRFVCNIGTNALNKIFATMYSELRKFRGENTSVESVVAYLITSRSGSGRFPRKEEFTQAFRSRNFYHANSATRSYLFECLENLDSNDTHDIAGALESGALTVEHIMPQSLTAEWKAELGADAEAIHAEWLHRIGNLTVTGYNSAYSNRSFQEKKQTKNGFENSPYRLNSIVKNSDHWNADVMRERTEALTSSALSYWSEVESDFDPPAKQMDTMPLGDETSFTNRTAVAFEFNGTRQTVQSWRDVQQGVFQLLVAEYHDEVFTFAETVSLLTTDRTRGKFWNEVIPGLWVDPHNSTAAKVALFRSAFDFLGIDTDELIIYLRPVEEDANVPAPEMERLPHAELIKFAPEFDSLVNTTALAEDTAEIREEWTHAMASFLVENPQKQLGNKRPEQIADKEFLDNCSTDDVLAAFTLLGYLDALVPATVHQAILNGTFSGLLGRLEELDRQLLAS